MKYMFRAILSLGALAASSVATSAACYQTTLVKPESMSCTKNSSNSADFSSSCQYQPAQYKQVTVSCPSPFGSGNKDRREGNGKPENSGDRAG